MKIPLAWLQLTHEKVRLLVALAGITFADVLMFMQLGFRDSLYDSAIRLHRNIEGDIFLLSPQSTSLISMNSFSERRLHQAFALDGVQSVSKIYLGIAILKNPIKRNTRNILVVGINPEDRILNLPGLEENLDKIKLSDVVLFDNKSRQEFGPIAQMFSQGQTVSTEVNRRKITVKGLFNLGTSFGADGTIVTSDLNFLRIFSRRQSGLIDVGVIKVKPGVDTGIILQQLRQELAGGDVNIFPREEFIAHEQNYWKTRTAIGFIFTLGTGMGFIVGMVIVYQVLYTDVADHLPEYATLKAIGYTDIYLLTLVLQQAVILGCIGYLPGYLLTLFLYYNAANATGLPIIMTLSRAIVVLVLTVSMCFISGGIAVGKLRSADPADIF
jgi:putative ABC transport system permease protein